MKLSGKVAWVTGAGRRLGRAIALGLAREGADVVVHYNRSRAEAEEVALAAEAMGRRTLVVQGDLSLHADIQRIAAEIRDGFGALDALVNAAATYPKKRFEDVTPEDLQAVLAANLCGPFWCAQAVLPMLRAARPGRIVNFTDFAVERPYKNLPHYMASKGGLRALTKALARDLAPDVLVNDIAPGPMLPGEGVSESYNAAAIAGVPLARWGGDQPIVDAVLFALTCDFVTGSTIVVDGGATIG